MSYFRCSCFYVSVLKVYPVPTSSDPSLPKREVQDYGFAAFIVALLHYHPWEVNETKKVSSSEWGGEKTPLSIPWPFPNPNILSKPLHCSSCVHCQIHQPWAALLSLYF